MLKARSDVASVEALPTRDGDAYTYRVEGTRGIDIRKSLFYELAAKDGRWWGWRRWA